MAPEKVTSPHPKKLYLYRLMPEISHTPLWLRLLNRWWVPLLFVIALFHSFNNHKAERIRGVIWSDQEGYYVYLPAVFIYGGFEGVPVKNCCRFTKDQRVDSKYTYGVSLLQTPFFLGAHALARLVWDENNPDERHAEKWEPNGFSEIYARGIMVAACFYLLLGLLLLKSVLKRIFPTPVALLTVTVVFLGTNLFYYTIGEAGMSHVYSFFLFALSLFLLPKFLEKPSLKRAAGLGLAMGLAVVIRPTNIVFGLVILGWEVYSWEGLRERLKFWLGQWPSLLLMAGLTILLAAPQMAYWQHLHGTWISYSYQDEGFMYWYRPKFFHVLFSYQNGLFMYAPVMLTSILGLYLGFYRKKVSSPMVTCLFVLCTWIFGSWWAWWFGGAFGHRSYVEWFAVLALPMGLFFHEILALKVNWPTILLLMVCAFCCYAAMKMAYMYAPPWDGESWTFSRFLGVWKEVLKFWTGWKPYWG